MKKTIFNVFVAMDSQEQCNRMKAVCLENGLPYGKNSSAFELIGEYNVFRYSNFCKQFMVLTKTINCTQVTEAEFLELLNEYKNGTQVHD